jgi:hypothetical protein
MGPKISLQIGREETILHTLEVDGRILLKLVLILDVDL